MVDQATVNGTKHPAQKLGRNVSGYAHDLVTLIELQLRLFAVDIRDSSRTAGIALGALGAGVLAAVGSIPLVFATVALAFVELAGWSYTAGFAASALLGVFAGTGCAYFGWRKLRSAGTTFGRSKTEAVETLRWIKESLRPSDPDEVPVAGPRF